MGRFLESMGCVAAYAACLGIAVIGVGCGGESVGEQIRGGNGGTGGEFVVPESVDSTCREFCANESEGSTCGPSARPGSFNPGSSDVRQCYERCLSGYEASTGVCRDEWIGILECHIDLDCEDLFGDCDSVEVLFNECVERANNRDYCDANCPAFDIAQCEQDTTDCQAFAVANTYCDSICPTQEREQCIAQHIASGTCGTAGSCSVPGEARLEDVSSPDTVIGDGSPASCTSGAFVDAVARGGVITFDCGPEPIIITLDRTAKVFNDQNPDVVIDGGGKVTLSGGGRVRILYQNTCDAQQVWTTSHCNDQDHPRLTVQNLTFVDGNAKAEEDGGGAIFVRGGRFKAMNTRFFNNVCHDVGPDVGGGAIRVFDMYQDRPVYVVNSTFGGEGLGNVCSNGGALSSIGVSYTVINSTLTHNEAIGNGANPQRPGTPGGGSGGAIYNDGNTFTLTVCDTVMENNTANEGGGAIFFVSNDRSGSLVIEDSVLRDNPSDGFETQGYPGIFVLANGDPQVRNSVIE